MADPRPDVCRVMAESLWEHVFMTAGEDAIDSIADAIRNHTIVPEMVRFLEVAGLRVDDKVLAIQISRCLAKAKGRK